MKKKLLVVLGLLITGALALVLFYSGNDPEFWGDSPVAPQ